MPETVAAGRMKRRQSRTLSSGREFRQFAVRDIEVRDGDSAGNTVTITGSPIVYGVPYTVYDMFGEFTETMQPGVATSVLTASPDVRFLFNHDGMPLARTIPGTLILKDTPEALTFSAEVDLRMSLANDLVLAIGRGDVSQMSCGFCVGMDVWNSDYTERSIFRLAELFDVSAVTYPASPTTSIELALRSMMAAPIESRARLRNVWMAAREEREGKVLSSANATLLQQALEALHEADDIDIPAIVGSLQTIDAALDAGQAGLAEVLGIADPDGDADDLDPELTDSTDSDGSLDEAGSTAAPGLMDGSGSRAAETDGAETREDGLIDLDEVVRELNIDESEESETEETGETVEVADPDAELEEARAALRSRLTLEAEQLRLRGRGHHI